MGSILLPIITYSIMPKLYVIGSSSKGNGYIIQGKYESLLLECGRPFSEFLKASDYDMSSFVGVLVSHRHSDHLKYVDQFINHSIKVFSNEDVQSIQNKVEVLKTGYRYSIGGEFIVQAIKLKHNAPNYGYVIDVLGTRIVFATDCMDFPYKIPHVNVWMIEMNNSDDVILENYVDDVEMRSQYQNHLSIEKAIKAIKINYSVDLQTIIGIHLSDVNSDKTLFSKEVIDEIGIEPLFAESGMIVELNNSEF